jgi:hypothetical protein
VQQVEISIRGIGTRAEAAQLLGKADSGLSLVGEEKQYGFREPLHSTFGEVVIFVGLVLNLAKLAETIYQLLQTKRASKKTARRRKRVEVCVLTPKGSKLFLRGSAEEIENLLKKELVDGE